MFDPLTTGQIGGRAREGEEISFPMLLVLAVIVAIGGCVRHILDALRGR